MKLMGLDYGDKTIGVALSDDLGMMAHPYETIFRKRPNKFRKSISRLKEIIYKENVSKIIIGYPLNMGGDEGLRCKETKNFVELLKTKLDDIPIIFYDERLSTFESNNILEDMNVKNQDRKKYIDKIAASIILQRYMDEDNNGK